MSTNKSRKSLTQKAGEKSGLVPQPHGGKIWQGAPANPVAGTGRPPSEIRAAMRKTLDEEVLQDLTKKYVAKEIDALGFANFLAKYGMGEKTEMTMVSPEITERLQATVNLISQHAPQLLTQLEEIWK